VGANAGWNVLTDGDADLVTGLAVVGLIGLAVAHHLDRRSPAPPLPPPPGGGGADGDPDPTRADGLDPAGADPGTDDATLVDDGAPAFGGGPAVGVSSPSDPSASATASAPSAFAATQQPVFTWTPPPAPDPEVVARRRRHARSRWATLAVAGLTGSGAAALWTTGAGHLPGWVVPASVLAVLAVGLAATPWVGWSWTLAAAVVLTIPFLVLSLVPGVSMRGGIGDRYDRPLARAELRRGYHLGIGTETVDLTGLALESGTTTRVAVGVGLGEAEVRVPDGVEVRLRGHLSGGAVDVDETAGDRGTDLDLHETIPATGAGADPAVVVVDVDGGFGRVHVVHEPA
jgi:hypothetical protein